MKKLLGWLELRIWIIRCQYGLWMHGPYGLSKVIERIPFRYINFILRRYGATIGTGGIIERGIYIHRPFGIKKPFENLKVGNNVYLGKEVILDLTMPLTLADAVSVGARVQIWTHSGYYQGTTVEERNYTEDRGAVYIDEGAMIYTNSVIKHGVRIGKFTSIASSSMVNRDVEDFAHASGVPIKVIQRTKLSN